ncbi:MAG: hypothetical protein FWD60_10685 [Candidatus Azobacteroides sp.]|nr:hypothetical protein [Candidatus Azobacteroides sp.]
MLKSPAPNVQFATSGGATRPSDGAEQHFWLSSKPLRYPRLRQAAASLHASGRHRGGQSRKIEHLRLATTRQDTREAVRAGLNNDSLLKGADVKLKKLWMEHQF